MERKSKVSRPFANLTARGSCPHMQTTSGQRTSTIELRAARKDSLYAGDRDRISTPAGSLGIQVTVRKGCRAHHSGAFQRPAPSSAPGSIPLRQRRGSMPRWRSLKFRLDGCGIVISRSRPGCPWENGYQESFCDKFKVDLGDPNRFKTLGELVVGDLPHPVGLATTRGFTPRSTCRLWYSPNDFSLVA